MAPKRKLTPEQEVKFKARLLEGASDEELLTEFDLQNRGSIRDYRLRVKVTPEQRAAARGRVLAANNDPGDSPIDPRLDKELRDFMRREPIPPQIYYGKTVRFGALGDTHYGSLYEHQDVLDVAYDVFKRERIANVYHTGDMLDGEKMRKGHEYSIYVHGADAQVDHCAANYPRRKGIKTHFILGSHDLSFWNNGGTDIGERLAEKRPDLNYLGREEVDIAVQWEGLQARVRLRHPRGGTAYALSHHPQKHIESLSGGQKPNLILTGHYHKAEYMPCYRNVFSIQTGCIQPQTDFMRGKNLAAHVGFWIVEFRLDPEGGIGRLKAEFFAHYESRNFETIEV